MPDTLAIVSLDVNLSSLRIILLTCIVQAGKIIQTTGTPDYGRSYADWTTQI
jgi:hypothetical protein